MSIYDLLVSGDLHRNVPEMFQLDTFDSDLQLSSLRGGTMGRPRCRCSTWMERLLDKSNDSRLWCQCNWFLCAEGQMGSLGKQEDIYGIIWNYMDIWWHMPICANWASRFPMVSCHFISFLGWGSYRTIIGLVTSCPLVMPCQAMAYDPKRDEIYYAFRSSTVKESINRFKRTDGSQGVDSDTAVYSGVFYEWLDASKMSNSFDGFLTWLYVACREQICTSCSQLCSTSTTTTRLLPVSNVVNSVFSCSFFLMPDAVFLILTGSTTHWARNLGWNHYHEAQHWHRKESPCKFTEK